MKSLLQLKYFAFVILVLFSVIVMDNAFAEPEKIQCNNDSHLLIERTNGKMACVSENTAEKTGWKIISQVNNVELNENSISNKNGNSNQELADLFQNQAAPMLTIQYTDVDFEKRITQDAVEINGVPGWASPVIDTIKYPEFLQVGKEFEVTISWSYTTYDEKGNIEKQNIPHFADTDSTNVIQSISLSMFDNVRLLNIEDDWEVRETTLLERYDRYNSVKTSYAINHEFDYTQPQELTFQLVLDSPFLEPFNEMTFGNHMIFHQDTTSTLFEHSLPQMVQLIEETSIEKLGSQEPNYVIDCDKIHCSYVLDENNIYHQPVPMGKGITTYPDALPPGMVESLVNHLINVGETPTAEALREQNFSESSIQVILDLYEQTNPNEIIEEPDNWEFEPVIDTPQEWYLGKGLKVGDYFVYSLCQINYKDCTEFEMNIWIKGDIQVRHDTYWLAEVVVYDGNKIIKGEMELGKIAAEPIGGSPELYVYQAAFKESVAYLATFANYKWPADFTEKLSQRICDPGCPQLIHKGSEPITTTAGTFDAEVLSWNINNNTKIWVVDEMPFPVKAKSFTFTSEGNDIPEYSFELLHYKENVGLSPFDTPLVYSDISSNDQSAQAASSEMNLVLFREVIYGIEGIGGIVTSSFDDILYYNVVDSDGKFIMPYYQELADSDNLEKELHPKVRMTSYGRGSFAMTTNILPAGEYSVILYGENTEIKKNFTIMESKCCRALSVSVLDGAYLPEESFRISVNATPHTELTFNLIDPNGEIKQTKNITTDKNGKINYETLTISRIAMPGLWTLEVKDGKNYDSIPIIIIPMPDELIKKSPTSQEIVESYHEIFNNKKSGYNVVLASSLDPFIDDGRQYRYKTLEHSPAPYPYFDMIKYGWIDTAGFEVNQYGVVTYLEKPHEKYSLDIGEGLYREDWLPEYIPDGQKIFSGETFYGTDEKNGVIIEKYGATYNFVPINFVVDENTTSNDLTHNMGFRISINYNSEQDEIEDILEERTEEHAERMGSYGGYETIMINGEMVILFEGGYKSKHYENSIYWIFDENYSISVRSYYYTLDELMPIFESIYK